MKKLFFIIPIVCVVGVSVAFYILFKKATSDEAIKARLLSALSSFGEAKINRVHMDLLEGITIENLSFIGTSEDVEGKSVEIPKIILKHNPQSLIKGQINISSAVIIAPELTIEKPTDIWSLLDAIKSNLDKAEIPIYVDTLHQGIEVRDLKLHVKENPSTNFPEIKLSGINVTLSPYAGSFKDIIITGNIDDAFCGNYSFTMRLHPGIPKLDIEIYTNNVFLNEEFLNRIPFIGKMLWDDYKPVGKINVSCTATFNNADGQKKTDYNININLNDLKAMYTNWPFIIYNLNGNAELNTEKLYLKNIVGYIKSGNCTSQAEFNGEFDLNDSKKTFGLTAPNLFINEELLKNIPKFGEDVWSKIRPTGIVDLTFQHTEGEKQESTNFVTITCKDLNINPVDFPFPISYVNGQFKLCNNIILCKNISGFIQCGDQSIFTEINGIYDINNDRKIFNFHAPNLSITESFLKNLPNKTIGENLWTNLNPAGKVSISGNFQGFKEKKDTSYSVEINLKDCEIAISKYKIPLWGIEGRLEFNKEGLLSKHIDAKCFGGHVEGAISVNTKTDPYQYEGELNFSRIILEEMSPKISHEEKQWSGLLYGRLKYRGIGTDPKNFYAEGHINVNEGYLSDVPVIFSILNFLNLSLPKKGSFHSAEAKFIVKNGIINIEEGKVYSDSVELDGRGNISLNGDLHLTIVAGFNKGFLSQIPIVGRVFDFVVGGVRKQLTMVEIRGTLSNPESHSVPFKPFTKSIKSMFDLLPKEDPDATSNAETKEEEKPPL